MLIGLYGDTSAPCNNSYLKSIQSNTHTHHEQTTSLQHQLSALLYIPSQNGQGHKFIKQKQPKVYICMKCDQSFLKL
jgi:hypothetical protein